MFLVRGKNWNMLTLMYDTIIIGSVDSIDTEREIRRSEKLNINKIIKSTPALYQSKSQKQQKNSWKKFEKDDSTTTVR